MLNTLREKTAGWTARIIIGIIIISFALIGLPEVFSSQQRGVLFRISDIKVTPVDFRNYESSLSYNFGWLPAQSFRARQIQLLSRLRQRELLRRTQLGWLAEDTLVDAHVRELGLGISDIGIARKISEYFQGPGGFGSRFNSFLNQNQVSEIQFVSVLRGNTLRTQLASVFNIDIKAPKHLIDTQHIYENETRILKYFVLDKKTLEKIKKPTDKELEDFYKNNIPVFTAPEYRTVAFVYLTTESIRKTIKIPEKTVKSVYDLRKKRYTKPERRTVQQLVFLDKKKAEAAHKKLASGKKFEDVAKEFGKKVIKLTDRSKSDFIDKKVGEESFKLKKNKLSTPIQGAFSIAIVRVTDIKPAVVTPLKKVAKAIEAELATEQAVQKVRELQKSIENDRGDAVKLKKIAEKYSLKYNEVIVDRQGRGIDGKKVSDIPGSAAFFREVFESNVDIDNEPVSDRGGTTWFDVLKVTKSRVKPLEEVKKEAEVKWTEGKEQKALNTKADEILAQLKKGEKIDVLAKKYSAKVITTKPIKRTERATKDIPTEIARPSFTMYLNEFKVTKTGDGNGRYLFQVSKIEKPKPLDKKQREQLETRISRGVNVGFFFQYIQAVSSKYRIVENQEEIRNVLGQRHR